MKHTKGPWKQHLVDETLIVDGRGEHVAQACGDYPLYAVEIEANARLISAAPDLLEACKAVVSRPSLPPEVMDQARAAIAKATGGSNV